MAAFEAFRTFKRRGLDARLAFYCSADLPADLRTWAFQLCRANMKARRVFRSVTAAVDEHVDPESQ